MKNTDKLPQPVINLRKIWDSRKREIYFTQTDAAKSLGMAQSMISQYLNNIKDLSPRAIIKLANFLDVDPRDIDPDVVEYLPNVQKRVFTYDSSDLNQRVRSSFYFQQPKTAFWVDINTRKTYLHLRGNKIPMANDKRGYICHALVCSTKEHPRATQFLVTLQGEKRAHLYETEALPAEKDIDKKYAILLIGYG